ncbi:MAG: PEP-CTERM sorting domain-containing protein [Pirellulales bacterium]
MLLQRQNRLASFVAPLLLAVFGLAVTTPCQATLIVGDPVLLSTLHNNPDGEILVGDKLFSRFFYSAVGDMPPVDRVNVTPIQDDDGNWGIRFTAPFIDFIDLVGNAGSDATIVYRVEALNESQLISDVHMAGNPALLGTTGSASVVETFEDHEIVLKIFDDFGNIQLTDFALLPQPVRFLDVQKNILLAAGNGSATLSILDQTFSQVPEPTAIALVMIGLALGSCCVRRRFSASA